MRKLGLLIRILIFLPFLGLMLYFLWAILESAERQKATAGFLAVEAEILESRVRLITSSDETESKAHIVYSYFVNGKQYTSSRIGYNVLPIISGKNVSERGLVQAYPVGLKVPAFYNPIDPTEAVLTNRAPEPLGLVLFVLALLAFFFALIVLPGFRGG